MKYLRDELVGKTQEQKANLKAEAIVKLKLKKNFDHNDLTIKIHSVNKIAGGIEVFTQAWRGKDQLGFGADGTVDIERFRIFNPPVLVDDSNGDIITQNIDPVTNVVRIRKLRLDPEKALQESLAHMISLVGKDGSAVIKGKFGNTTSTFYVGAGDGWNYQTGTVWATVRNASTGITGSHTGTTQSGAPASRKISATYYDIRAYFPINSAALPDTDDISSATFSWYNGTGGTGTKDFMLVESGQASTSAVANADYGTMGTTAFSDVVNFNAATPQWANHTLTAAGIAAINKTGWTKFAVIDNLSFTDVAPTAETYPTVTFSEYTGTSSDPKLVVEHAAPAPTTNLVSIERSPMRGNMRGMMRP